MINQSCAEYVLQIVYFFYNVGDITLVAGLQHHDELALVGLAMNFRAGELFDMIFYGCQVFGFGVYHQTRNMNFLVIDYATLPARL